MYRTPMSDELVTRVIVILRESNTTDEILLEFLDRLERRLDKIQFDRYLEQQRNLRTVSGSAAQDLIDGLGL